MKIYIYLRHFPPFASPINNGTTKAVHGFASGLVSCNAEVEVLCEGASESSFVTDAGYAIKCFANLKKEPTFSLASGLKQYVRDRITAQDLVLLNGIFHTSVFSLSRLLVKHFIPYIVVPHDPYHPSIFVKNYHLKFPYWHLLEKRLLTEAKAIQVLDIRHAQWLQGLGIKTPVIEVPNGFDANDLPLKSSLRWSKNGVSRIFFLGRLDAYNKGLDILLNSLHQIVNSHKVELIIQGPDWGDKNKLKKLAAKLFLSKLVFFKEPNYEVFSSSIIQEYDIFCLPSRFEGFGLAALEAMVAGRPLLISEVSGLVPHVISSGCGVIAKPEIASVKAGLLKLLKRRSLWQEMGLKGRDYVLQNLSWQKIAATALEKYQALK